MILLLILPVILLGSDPGKTTYVLTPEIPDTIKGLQIRFEVKQISAIYQGLAVNICCLCADITNKKNSPERFLVRYQCRGKKKTKKIDIGSRQQRIILVDKCVLTGEHSSDIKEYYSLLGLEYSQ